MKQLFTIILILVSGSVLAQNESIKPQAQSEFIKPTFYIVLKSTRMELDSASIQRINPDWIKKIEVIKEQKNISLHGDKNGIIYIYPKRKYRHQIADVLTK